MSTKSVGIRELKDHASEILHAVRGGATVRITDRHRPVALIVPVSETITVSARIADLVKAGIVAYRGGKPRGLDDRNGDADVAAAVIEDRR